MVEDQKHGLERDLLQGRFGRDRVPVRQLLDGSRSPWQTGLRRLVMRTT